ncbi:MAG: substrate-binding domain-containing protein [Gammaproteobacteria bacterium]
MFCIMLIACVAIGFSHAGERYITLASTTSTENSGLYDYLLPLFTARAGIEVRVVAVGTGKAIKMAEKGDADVLLVHHKVSEEKFVAAGHGVERFDVMYNDFVIVGPDSDPAGIAGAGSALEALKKIASSKSAFASRGDDSGTHKREVALWRAAGIDPTSEGQSWYRETGSGMGATLNVGIGLEGYILTDRSTWLNFSNKGKMKLLVENDPDLFNQYGVILVSPARHSHIKADDGQAFIDWLVSRPGQQAINAYRIKDQQAFYANAAEF